MWAWVIDHRCRWKQADETLLQLPPAFSALHPEEEPHVPMPESVEELIKQLPSEQQAIITTDCKSLYGPDQPHSATSVYGIQNNAASKAHQGASPKWDQIRWVPSGAQIADSLTKVMDNTMLRTCLHKGFYSLHDEQEILKARSDSRSRLQWLQSQAPLSESSAVTHGKAKSSMSQSQFAKIN